MNERIRVLRKTLGLTLKKAGERLGVSESAMSNIEKGNRNVTDQMFVSICREFNVNENWLRNGEGEMFNTIPNSTMEQLRNEFHLDDFSFNLVYEYLKLTEEKRSVVRELFQNAMVAEQTALGSISEEPTGQYTMILDEAEDTSEPKTNSIIEEKVDAYRKELEAESKGVDESSVSQTGNDA